MGQFRTIAAIAAAAAFSATAYAQQAVNLKMQATWPASLTLYENFTYFVERVGKISGGAIKIDAMDGSLDQVGHRSRVGGKTGGFKGSVAGLAVRPSRKRGKMTLVGPE